MRLKAWLVRGTFRRSQGEAIGMLLGYGLVIGGGTILGAAAAVAGRSDPERAQPVLVTCMAIIPAMSILFGVVLGSEGSVDPRRLAPLPIPRLGLGLGSLASGAMGLGGVGFGLIATGIIIGFTPLGIGAPIAVAAVVVTLAMMLVISRLVSNVLGIMTSGRLEKVANMAVALTTLATAILAQGISRVLSWPTEEWIRAASRLRFLPTARLGEAVATAGTNPGAALVDLAIGVATLIVLVWLHSITFARFLVALPTQVESAKASEEVSVAAAASLRRYTKPAWAVAWRSLVVKVRHPRQLTNLIVAVALGLGGIVGVIVMTSGVLPPTTVLLGGAVQFLVLFDNQNCFGMDGSAFGLDLLCGSVEDVVRGKRLAAAATAAIPGFVMPVILAVVTGGWSYLPIAWVLAVASATAASGMAVAMSALAPVAMPVNANPFASADAGQGCMASIAFVVALTALSLVTAGTGFLLILAVTVSYAVVVAVAALAVGLGWLIGWSGERLAVTWLANRVPEMFAAITPRS